MLERVPVDEYGMPYLLHPYAPPPNVTARWDDDHSFFFNSSPELGDFAGRALRYSRVQHVPRWLHDRKHNIHFPDGIEQLPEGQADKFGLAVMACAGYVSPFAIDVRANQPKLVRMKPAVYDFVRGKNQLHLEARRDYIQAGRTQRYAQQKIGQFFANYAQQQEIQDLNESLIDNFLHTKDQRIKRNLGNLILMHAIEVAVEPLAPIYRTALKEKLIRPSLNSPAKVVIQHFKKSKWSDYHKYLEQKLVA